MTREDLVSSGIINGLTRQRIEMRKHDRGSAERYSRRPLVELKINRTDTTGRDRRAARG